MQYHFSNIERRKYLNQNYFMKSFTKTEARKASMGVYNFIYSLLLQGYKSLFLDIKRLSYLLPVQIELNLITLQTLTTSLASKHRTPVPFFTMACRSFDVVIWGRRR